MQEAKPKKHLLYLNLDARLVIRMEKGKLHVDRTGAVLNRGKSIATLSDTSSNRNATVHTELKRFKAMSKNGLKTLRSVSNMV